MVVGCPVLYWCPLYCCHLSQVIVVYEQPYHKDDRTLHPGSKAIQCDEVMVIVIPTAVHVYVPGTEYVNRYRYRVQQYGIVTGCVFVVRLCSIPSQTSVIRIPILSKVTSSSRRGNQHLRHAAQGPAHGKGTQQFNPPPGQASSRCERLEG